MLLLWQQQLLNSYGLDRVIIASCFLTNLQGCHGNCSWSGMCVQSTMVEGTCIMQIQRNGDLLPDATFTDC